MNKVIDIIRSLPLFRGLAEDQFQALTGIAREIEYSKGNLIFSDGDVSSGFYIVKDGKVKIFKLSPEGKQQILHLYGPGHPFGEVPVFSGENFPANAVAVSAVTLLFFPRDEFVRLITAHPSLALNMLAELSRRLREFTDMVENLALKEVPARMAAYFISLSREQKNQGMVTLPMTKTQLAELVGTTPETISRVFGKMAAAGMVDVNHRKISILDPEGLAEMAGKEQAS